MFSVALHPFLGKGAMRSVLTIFLALLSLLFVSALQPQNAAAAGKILCVDGTGGSSYGDPCTGVSYATINDAIAAATTGDEIRVLAGTYKGPGSSVVTINKAVSITGGYDGSWVTPVYGPEYTIIDGVGVRKGVTIVGNIAATVQNLRIVNGGIANNTGILNVNSYTLDLAGIGDSNGHFNISALGKVRFPADTPGLSSGTTFTGAGYAELAGANLKLNGTLNFAQLQLAAGSLNGNSVVSGNLSVLNGIDITRVMC